MERSEKITRAIINYKKAKADGNMREQDKYFREVEDLLNKLILKECSNNSYNFTTKDYVYQDLLIELWNAIESYDVKKKVKFSTLFVNIMMNYRKNSYLKVKNICNKIYAYYPSNKVNPNVYSYDEKVSKEDTFRDLLEDTENVDDHEKVILNHDLDNSDLDDLDRSILKLIINDESSIYQYVKDKNRHRMDADYICKKCNITGNKLRNRINKIKNSEFISDMFGSIIQDIDSIPNSGNLDNILKEIVR